MLSNTAVAGLVAGLCIAQAAAALALVLGATRWAALVAVFSPLAILAICANRMQLGSSGTGLRGVEILFLGGNLASVAAGLWWLRGAEPAQSATAAVKWGL